MDVGLEITSVKFQPNLGRSEFGVGCGCLTRRRLSDDYATRWRALGDVERRGRRISRGAGAAVGV
jgi:hypothetical protein